MVKYEALVSKILGNTEATNIKQLLISKINPHADIVKLLDSALEAPCDSRAAPIHKLMVHFAIRYGTINFIRGQLEECVDAKSYKIQDLVLDPSKVKFVIRHGAGLLSGIF
jgi:hypothetical protein